MKDRFRVKRADGEERIGGLDAFLERVRTGAIDPTDLIYDAATGEWAPARAHPAFLGIHADDPDDPPAEEELELALVADDEPSPGAAAAAFIEQMEQERWDEGADRSDGAVDLVDLAESEPDEPSPHGRVPPPERTDGPRPLAATEPPLRPGRPGRRPAAGLRSSLPVWAGVVFFALAGLAVLFGPSLRSVGTSAEATPPGIEPPPPPPGDAELAAQAYADFVEAVARLRHAFRLGPVPERWLSGEYLAAASAYPGLEEFWMGFERYVEAARDSESDLYRQALLDVLQDGGVEGPMRTLKLRRGLATFAAGAEQRRDAYERNLELASSALSLHRFLVRSEETIRYEPARSERLSVDPVTEAAGSDEATQAGLDEALDRVLAALDGVGTDGGAVAGAEPIWLPRLLADRGG